MVTVLSGCTAMYESISASSGGPDTRPRCAAVERALCAADTFAMLKPTTTAPVALRNSRRARTQSRFESATGHLRFRGLPVRRQRFRGALNGRENARVG